MEKEMERLVSPFSPRPRRLLEAITRGGSFVGGSTAVKFFLRYHTFTPFNLDLYVPSYAWAALIEHLVHGQGGELVDTITSSDDDGAHLRARSICDHTKIDSQSGRRINMYRPEWPDALLPVVRTWCSALANYFNLDEYGSAYPQLLFEGRGVVGWRVVNETDLVRTWKA